MTNDSRTMAGTVLPDHVPDFLPDGLYVDMPEADYHNSPSLGSSDKKLLARNPCEFWFSSKFNPDWLPEEDTPSLKFGRAAHKCTLEGQEAFRKLYMPVMEPGNTKAGKAQREYAGASGKTWLKYEDYRRVEYLGAMIRENPKLVNAFSGGFASEVSIFWTTSNGMRNKCRIDYLKLKSSVDLKTIANPYDKEFPDACRNAISNYRYDVQSAHYQEGRAQLKRLIADDRVFQYAGPGKYSRVGAPELLLKIAAQESWAFVFVFAQSSGAPLTWACQLSSIKEKDGMSHNPLIVQGQRMIELADYNWHVYNERFGGLKTPWVLTEEIGELQTDDFFPWSFR
jgi:PDDEXK-like uncharacterized protein DUF3799